MNAVQIVEVAEPTIAHLTRFPEQDLNRERTPAQARQGGAREIDGDEGQSTADVPDNSGGAVRRSDQGSQICDALASSLAMDCWTWAARLGVPLDSVDIKIETQRCIHGLDDQASANYQRVSCSIQVTSPASEDAINHIVELAQAYNAQLSDVTNSMAVECDLRILGANGAAKT